MGSAAGEATGAIHADGECLHARIIGPELRADGSTLLPCTEIERGCKRERRSG